MSGIGFDINGLVELMNTVGKLRERFGDAGLLAMTVHWADEIGPKIAQKLSQNAPKVTGRLAGSIRYQRETAAGAVEIQFHSNVPYAGYVIGGTKPHIIEPVAARALHWHDTRGADVFAMVVHHPGTKPNPFNQRTLDDMRGEIITSYMEAIRIAAAI